jgi:hypothetical protein
MKKRGAHLDEECWAKVEVLESEPSKLDLGLGEAKYNEVLHFQPLMKGEIF